jgi:tetratricopeptide (TPR) repeat protein
LKIKKFEALLSEGIQLYHEGRFNESLMKLHQVKQINPNDLEILSFEVSNYIELKDYSKARRINRIILHKYPYDPLSKLNMAKISYKTGDLTNAESYFKKASEIAPDDLHLMYEYGEFMFQLGRYHEAIPLLNQSITLECKGLNVFKYLILSYYEIGIISKSREIFTVVKAMINYDGSLEDYIEDIQSGLCFINDFQENTTEFENIEREINPNNGTTTGKISHMSSSTVHYLDNTSYSEIPIDYILAYKVDENRILNMSEDEKISNGLPIESIRVSKIYEDKIELSMITNIKVNVSWGKITKIVGEKARVIIMNDFRNILKTYKNRLQRFSRADYKDFVQKIDQSYNPRILLDDYPNLALEMELSGRTVKDISDKVNVILRTIEQSIIKKNIKYREVNC